MLYHKIELRLGKEGMKETDVETLHIMVGN